jgi:hypothetical protein
MNIHGVPRPASAAGLLTPLGPSLGMLDADSEQVAQQQRQAVLRFRRRREARRQGEVPPERPGGLTPYDGSPLARHQRRSKSPKRHPLAEGQPMDAPSANSRQADGSSNQVPQQPHAAAVTSFTAAHQRAMHARRSVTAAAISEHPSSPVLPPPPACQQRSACSACAAHAHSTADHASAFSLLSSSSCKRYLAEQMAGKMPWTFLESACGLQPPPHCRSPPVHNPAAEPCPRACAGEHAHCARSGQPL